MILSAAYHSGAYFDRLGLQPQVSPSENEVLPLEL
jgi:hypothetical protein